MIEADAPGLTFAIADLHGRDDLLDLALAAVTRRGAREPAGARTIVFLGDYIDRGPGSCAVLDRLIAGPPDGWTWICLRGNHEAMMGLALRNPDRLDWWMGNGGAETIASYRDSRERIAAHLAWIDSLAAIHLDGHRVYVHAGVDPAIPIDRQQDKILLWKRYPPGFAIGHGHRHVVHGHDPHRDGPLFQTGRTDLDTLAWATGRLVVGLFDDQREGGPVDTIEILARNPGRAPPASGTIRFRGDLSAMV